MSPLRASIAAGIVALLVAVPSAAAQTSLEEALDDIRFGDVIISIGPETAEFRALDFRLTGNAAADFRQCLDGRDECPIPQVRQAQIGNGDGSVSSSEVQTLKDLILSLWTALPEIRAVVESTKEVVLVDGRPADAVELKLVDIDGAEGGSGSTSAITIGFVVMAHYRQTPESDRHDIVIERTTADITLADRVIIGPASGWKISEASIQPTTMTSLLDDGQFAGSQDDFEGDQPLSFQIEESNSNALLWVASGLALAVAAGITFFFVYKRRKA